MFDHFQPSAKEEALFEGAAQSAQRECIGDALTRQVQSAGEAYFTVRHESQARIAPVAFRADDLRYPICGEFQLC